MEKRKDSWETRQDRMYEYLGRTMWSEKVQNRIARCALIVGGAYLAFQVFMGLMTNN